MATSYDETGFSKPKPGDECCNRLVRTLKNAVQSVTGSHYADFQCVEYVDQVAYGTNYKAKVGTGGGSYIHLHFFNPPNERPPQLNFIEMAKSATDPLNDVFNTRYFNKAT